MRAGHGFAPREAASEEKPRDEPRDDEDADRRKAETDHNMDHNDRSAARDRDSHLDLSKLSAHAERRANAALRRNVWASASSRPPRFEEVLCAATGTGRGSAPCLPRRRARANERVVVTTRQR